MSNENSQLPQINAPEPWVRLWLPASEWEKHPGIDEDFLSDHGAKGGVEHWFAESLPGIGALPSFADVPFLMLLGRPGSGKSQELRDAGSRGWLGTPVIHIEAKEIGGENASTYLQLHHGSAPPSRIIIDGLDEARLQNGSFISQVKAWLRMHLGQDGLPVHRLAISCRWADWPESEIDQLEALWPADQSRRLILCPLRRSDVVATLKGRFGGEAEEFWRQMHDLRLSSVACWPQSLLSLMNQFASSTPRKLAASHADIVREEVIRHCRLADSPDDTLRWPSSVEGSEWRQRVAGRLAAAMIWSGRSELDLSLAASDPASRALSPGELGKTDEEWRGNRATVELADLAHIVDRSGLLKRLGDQRRWVFQSQVFQEWLAADWLAAQRLDIPQFRSLFGTVIDGIWRVFPALSAVAAWLARFDSPFRKLVLENDPLVLFRMDGASLPTEEREDIIEALLVATNRARVVDPGIRHAHLPSLVHPKLKDQLGRWLQRDDTCDPAKELAIEIAEKTNLRDLAPLLWDLFPKAAGRLQIEIAGALMRLAEDGFDDEWRAVLRGQTPIDLHGTILGAAIEIMVNSSHKVPVRDILDWIVPTRHFEVHGFYEIAARQVHEHLTPEDLPAAFKKLGEHPMWIHDSLSNAQALNSSAIKLAIREFDRPEIATALADYWHRCQQFHAHPHHDYNQSWDSAELGLEDHNRRRQIVLKLMLHEGFAAETKQQWLLPEEFLLIPDDLDWCLDQLSAAKPDDKWRFALAVRAFAWRADLSGDRGDKLVTAWTRSLALRAMMPQPEPGESIVAALTRIESEHQAKRDRERVERERKQAKRDFKFQQDLADYTKGCRDAHLRGDLVWPGVERILGARAHGPSGRTITFEPISKIGPDDEWMVDAAARFLVEFPRKNVLEDGHGTLGLLALAACITELDGEGSVFQSVAEHWLPLFIGHLIDHYLGTVPEGISNERFAKLMPEQFVPAFGRVIRERYCKGSSLSELAGFASYWTPPMTTELVRVLHEEAVHPEGFHQAMLALAKFDEASAITIAREKLASLTPNTSKEVRASVAGATAVNLNGCLWSDLADLLADNEIAASAICSVARRVGIHECPIDFTSWSSLALKQLADVCWRAFPQLERRDRSVRGFHEVTGIDMAIDFRDAVTSAARARGIEVTIPEKHKSDTEDQARQRVRSIDWNRHAAAQARAGQSWQHMSVDDFFHLTTKPSARLARNAGELMNAVVECLQRWEAALKGGEWDHLWDVSSRISRPEKRIAREMRDWLRRELDVVVEREVEIASEDRTDVLVQTTPRDGSPPLTVVVEVKKVRKGNSAERRIAMKTQLVDRYLRPRLHEGWTHGLYVVAWTPEPDSAEDNEQAIRSARIALDFQASELSKPPIVLQSMVIDARFPKNKGSKRNETKAPRKRLARTSVE